MTMQISYMGTKRQIAPLVSDAISSCKEGPLLDLFSGMCAVGSEVGTRRQVWSNDAQLFAANVARAFFTSVDLPLRAESLAGLLRPHFIDNQSVLNTVYSSLLTAEEVSMEAGCLESLLSASEKILTHRSFPEHRSNTTSSPYCLFSEIHAGGYFSLKQAIEIDSIRYAADQVLKEGAISFEQHRWILLSLAQALSKVANTTGHFAQYLKLKDSNLDRCINQKKRAVWAEWLNGCDFMTPVGGKAWRKRNKVFNGCSLDILGRLYEAKEAPAVIYADPPYTDDQYSRFYHIYETLFLYDYPEVTGIGQYRPNRFKSSFSLKSEVVKAITQLIASCSYLNADLVLSYPDNGLLPNVREFLPELLKEHYPLVDIAYDVSHKHSSLGGSKGQQKYDVQELIFIARKRN